MTAETIDAVIKFGKEFGMAGLILACWMFDSYRKDRQIMNILNGYHAMSESTLKMMTKVKTLLQLKLTGALDDEEN